MIKLTMEDWLREPVSMYFLKKGEQSMQGERWFIFPPGNFFSIFIEQTQNSLRNLRQVTSADNKAYIIYLCNTEQLPANSQIQCL